MLADLFAGFGQQKPIVQVMMMCDTLGITSRNYHYKTLAKNLESCGDTKTKNLRLA